VGPGAFREQPSKAGCLLGWVAVLEEFQHALAHLANRLLGLIRTDTAGKPAIHYTTVYKVFARWSDDGSLAEAFIASVAHLADHNQLDLSVLHGDGTNTVAKKGGDGIGYSGHKHQQGEKVIAIIDNNGYVLAPLPVAPVNEADTVLLPEGLKALKRVARLTGLELEGAYLNLDGGFDSKSNRKAIFNAGMIPNIKENPRNRKTPKRGRKRLFNQAIHALRKRIERTFAWEDKFKRLLLRFEYLQRRHYGMKLMASITASATWSR
jgi:hypothetical protein